MNAMNKANVEPMLLRMSDVVELLQVSRGVAYELVNSGQIPSIRFGRSIRVPVEALRKWIESQQAL